MNYSEEEKTVYIYSLSHPTTKEIRYIGKANDISKRLKGHLNKSKTSNTHFHNWIKSITNIGLIPIIKIVKTTNESNWCEDEKRAILDFRNNGCNLLNIAEGGNMPFCSKEQRAINGRNVANTIHSDAKKKRFWYLKHELGICLRHMYKNGQSERANEMRRILSTKGVNFNINGH